MTTARRATAAAHAAVVLGVLLVALLTASVLAAPGAEAASYRYWTYWWGQPATTSWTFAQLGPASDRPKDGAVLGWRFAVTTESGGKKAPRASLPFAALCPALTTAPDGQKRVAVVVDYGTTSDAPPGETPPGGGTVRVECVTVAATANGVTVLNAAGVTLRFGDNGLVCGIDRYPRTECAAIVADPTPTPKPTSAKPTPAPSSKPSTARPTTPSTAGSTSPTSRTASASSAAAGTPPASPTASSPEATTTSASALTEPTTSDDASTEAPLPVSSGAPAPSGTEDGGGSPVAPIVGVALVGALGAGAWWTTRGRRA